jgi:DNA-binding NarL/FixJ family response regulator
MGAADRVTFVQVCAEGRPIKEIAGHLEREDGRVVEFHKHHIMETFNLKSNADLVLFALKHGLISMDSNSSLQTLSS